MNDVIEHLNDLLDEDERIAGDPDSWQVIPNQDSSHFDIGYRDSTACAVRSTDEGGIYDRVIAEHIARHDPARVLAEAGVVRQIISDYRAADGAILRADRIDHDDPGWRGIYAGRDAFRNVLMAYAKATGWEG